MFPRVMQDPLRAKKYRREADQDEEGLCEYSPATEDQMPTNSVIGKWMKRIVQQIKFSNNDARTITEKCS